MDLTLRPANHDDLDLIWGINLAGLGETVQTQFGVSEEEHRKHFESHFLVDGVQIITTDGVAIGYLHYEERSDHFYVGGIVLIPEYQRGGIGTHLMASIEREAAKQRLDVRLQVLKSNPAVRFYEKLGFDIEEETEDHHQLVKRPPR